MERILPGWQAALNHHPVFVHFPIVLWLGALLFEIAAVWRHNDGTHRAAMWLLWLGTLGGAFAVLSGLQAQKLVPAGPVGHVLEAHEQLMFTCFFLALGLSFFAYLASRRLTRGLQVVILAGLLVLGFLVTVGADRGAEMVYRYGLGVNWSTAVRPK
ncbi:MAG TPA: DUF2231 domain-containing protein [Candidatus Dormibacteraeota bacterium]|nr:DUF2231 domain-containing protein [Candidatus Dormibacteraeota bacterium]